MRKRFILGAAVLLISALFLSGCRTADNLSGSGTENQTAANDGGKEEIQDRTESEADKDTEELSDVDFDVAGHLYTSPTGSSFCFVTVTNNSDATVSVSGSAEAKDADGNAVGTASMTKIGVLAPGETSASYFFFSDGFGIDRVEYDLSYTEETRYKPVIGSLAVEQHLNDRNVVLSVTNNGDTAARFVRAYALFFDADNNVLDFAEDFITDIDYEIKPGAALTVQLNFDGDSYDRVEVYLVGHNDGSSAFSTEKADVSDEDFEIKEYLYEYYEYSGGSVYYLIVTNNSAETVSFFANGTAKDADGNIIGAGDTEIDVLGPGETSVGYLYFSGVTGIETVEYQTAYGAETNLKPVVGDLSLDVSVNAEDVTVTVTNNGDIAARYVEAYAVFLTADNTVADVVSNYLVDDDYEIKPGAALSEKFSCHSEFDRVEVYLTGMGVNEGS